MTTENATGFKCSVEEEDKPCPEDAVVMEETRGSGKYPLCERHANVFRAARGLMVGAPRQAQQQAFSIGSDAPVEKTAAARFAEEDRIRAESRTGARGGAADYSPTLGVPTPAQPGTFRDKAHVKSFLLASGRKYLVLHAPDLIDALPFPDGVEMVQQMIAMYGQHRAMQETGWEEPLPAAFRTRFAGKPPETMPVMKDETPTIEEIDEAITQLQAVRGLVLARLSSIKAKKRIL